MNKQKAKKLFKKHYNYAMKLKEGGKDYEKERITRKIKWVVSG
jgi:hypothetical protein